MNASGEPRASDRRKRVFAILGVFVLIVPPIGALTYLLLAALVEMTMRRFQPGQYVEAVWFVLLYGIPIGSALLVVPAAIAGLAVGIWQAFVGWMRWWLALATGVVLGAGFHAMFRQVLDGVSGGANGPLWPGTIVIAALAIPTLVAWAVVRNWHLAARTSVTPQ